MQLRRPATTSTWSNARGGQQVQRGENTVKQVCLLDVLYVGYCNQSSLVKG